jgi:hypothetical protein
LQEFYAGKCNIVPACCHSPDELTDTSAVFNLHQSFESGLILRIVVAHSSIEFLEPCAVPERGRAVFCEGNFVEPGIEVFGAKFIDVGVTINLDVVLCLHDINAIEHIREALSFDGHGKFFVEHIEEDIGSVLVWRSNFM